MTKIITEKMKEQFGKNTKGTVYLFLVQANNLSIANQYNQFSVDTGVRSPENYINNRIEELFNEQTGAYWKDEYKGYENILEKARVAKDDIIKGTYSLAVIEFVEAAIRSYVPKQAERPKTVELSEQQHLDIAKEQAKKEIHLDVEETIVEKKAKTQRANDRTGLAEMAMALDDDNSLAIEAVDPTSEEMEDMDVVDEELIEENIDRGELGNLGNSL